MDNPFLKSEHNQSANQPSGKTAQNREFENLEDTDDEQPKSQSSSREKGLISLTYVSSRGFFFQ